MRTMILKTPFRITEGLTSPEDARVGALVSGTQEDGVVRCGRIVQVAQIPGYWPKAFKVYWAGTESADFEIFDYMTNEVMCKLGIQLKGTDE